MQAASSYNQQLMSREGIQGMVDAVTSLGTGDGTSGGYIEHKMLGVRRLTSMRIPPPPPSYTLSSSNHTLWLDSTEYTTSVPSSL